MDVTRWIGKSGQPVVDGAKRADLRRQRPPPPVGPCPLHGVGQCPDLATRQARYRRSHPCMAKPDLGPAPPRLLLDRVDIAEGDGRGTPPEGKFDVVGVHGCRPGIPRAEYGEHQSCQPGSLHIEPGPRIGHLRRRTGHLSPAYSVASVVRSNAIISASDLPDGPPPRCSRIHRNTTDVSYPPTEPLREIDRTPAGPPRRSAGRAEWNSDALTPKGWSDGQSPFRP